MDQSAGGAGGSPAGLTRHGPRSPRFRVRRTAAEHRTIGSCLRGNGLACRAMLSFAVSAMQKLHRVPRENLINLGLGLLVLVVVIVLVKVAARVNKFVLFAILFVLVLVVGFTWVYERNEPKFLKPFIDSIAPFFPQRPHY